MNSILYSLRDSYDSKPGGTSSEEPVISLPNSSEKILIPPMVTEPAISKTTIVFFRGISPIFPHNFGKKEHNNTKHKLKEKRNALSESILFKSET